MRLELKKSKLARAPFALTGFLLWTQLVHASATEQILQPHILIHDAASDSVQKLEVTMGDTGRIIRSRKLHGNHGYEAAFEMSDIGADAKEIRLRKTTIAGFDELNPFYLERNTEQFTYGEIYYIGQVKGIWYRQTFSAKIVIPENKIPAIKAEATISDSAGGLVDNYQEKVRSLNVKWETAGYRKNTVITLPKKVRGEILHFSFNENADVLAIVTSDEKKLVYDLFSNRPASPASFEPELIKMEPIGDEISHLYAAVKPLSGQKRIKDDTARAESGKKPKSRTNSCSELILGG